MDIKISNALEHIDTGDRFLNITPVAQTPRETKWIQETSWHWKASAKQRTWPTRQYDGLHNGKRSSLTPHQTEVWSPQYTKNSRNWSSKEQRIQLTKWSTDLNRELSTEESKMADRRWRKWSTSLVIREMYIKTSFYVSWMKEWKECIPTPRLSV